MTNRPPSPTTPTASPTISSVTTDSPAQQTTDEEMLATTTHLTTAIENALGDAPTDAALEDALVELDRCHVVDWVAVTRDGDYVWDLSQTPDRVAEAVATALVDRFDSWLEGMGSSD